MVRRTKQRVAETVVQHELAHQWFGNLVTMDFWDGLWLNEGFATWMSWYSCNLFFPEWRVWEGYVTDNLASALALDSLRSSHPIEVPVQRADEINQIFDAISYSKGSSVLRMISKYLGEDTFMEGIRRYLKKHAYGNTQTGDLWAALSEASGKNVGKVMDIWTKKVGYPVVTVTEKAGASQIHLQQNRFLRTADVKPEEDETLYPVFVGLRTRSGVDEQLTLFSREADYAVPDMDFFKLNAEHSGLYRTSYSPERLRKLGEAAQQGLLGVEDRAGMISDAGALAASGYQATSGVLSLLESFKSEPAFVVWQEITARIGLLRGAWMFEDAAVRDGLEKFQLHLTQTKAHELGWSFDDGDGHVYQQFKGLMFGAAGLAHDDKIVRAAFDLFARFQAGDRAAVHPNLRSSIYAIVLSYGGRAEYDAVRNEAVAAKTSDERNSAMRSLGRAKDPELIARTLAFCLSDEVKAQDIYLPISGLRHHAEGVDALWAWVQANWAELERRLPPSLTMLSTVVAMTTAGFTHEHQLRAVEAFFAGKKTHGFDKALAQSADAIRAKAQWVRRDGDHVKAWLAHAGYL